MGLGEDSGEMGGELVGLGNWWRWKQSCADEVLGDMLANMAMN